MVMNSCLQSVRLSFVIRIALLITDLLKFSSQKVCSKELPTLVISLLATMPHDTYTFSNDR